MAAFKGLYLGLFLMLGTFVLSMIVLFAGYENKNNINLVTLNPPPGNFSNFNIEFNVWQFCININGNKVYCGDGQNLNSLTQNPELNSQFPQLQQTLEPVETILNYYSDVKLAAKVILIIFVSLSGLTVLFGMMSTCCGSFTTILTAFFALLTTLVAIAIVVCVPVGYNKVKGQLEGSTITLDEAFWMIVGAAISCVVSTILLIWNVGAVRRRRRSNKF